MTSASLGASTSKTYPLPPYPQKSSQTHKEPSQLFSQDDPNAWKRNIIKTYLDWNKFGLEPIYSLTPSNISLSEFQRGLKENLQSSAENFGYMLDTRFPERYTDIEPYSKESKLFWDTLNCRKNHSNFPKRVEFPDTRVFRAIDPNYGLVVMLEKLGKVIFGENEFKMRGLEDLKKPNKGYTGPYPCCYGGDFPLRNKNLEVIDVDVSIRYSIIKSLVSRHEYFQRRIINPCLVFEQIKSKFLDSRRRRIFFIEEALKGHLNYTLYRQDRYGGFTLIAEIRDKCFIDITGIFDKYFQIPSDEKFDAISNSNIYDLIIAREWKHIPANICISYGRGYPEAVTLADIPSYMKLASDYLRGKSGLIDVDICFSPIETLRRWKGISVKTALNTLRFQSSELFREHLWECCEPGKKVRACLKQASKTSGRIISDEFTSFETEFLVPFTWPEEWFKQDTLDPLYRRSESSSIDNVVFVDTFVDADVINYVLGRVSLIDLKITKDNAYRFLNVAKVIDRGVVKDFRCQSTYEIRRQVAILNELSTPEVFTNTFDPEKYNNVQYLDNPNNWIDQRVGWQARLIMHQQIRSRALSQRITPPVILAVRGNSGVGKSASIAKVIMDKELTGGVINPDLMKVKLKNITSKCFVNNQVRFEAKMLFEKFIKMLTENVAGIQSLIIDARLLDLEDLNAPLSIAKMRKSQLKIEDIEGPIWNSIIAVLNRLDDSSPRVTFEVIKDGYIRARKHRREFIKECLKEGVNYSLYYKNENGDSTLIDKENEELMKSLRIENETDLIRVNAEIDAIGRMQINEELIEKYGYKDPDPKFNKKIPEKWIGYTIQAALKAHSEKNFL